MESKEKELELMIERMIKMMKSILSVEGVKSLLIDDAKNQVRETIEEAEGLIR